jgi:Tol biopolymer transport system component
MSRDLIGRGTSQEADLSYCGSGDGGTWVLPRIQWSPRGNAIAFDGHLGDGRAEIFVLNPSTGRVNGTLTPTNDWEPAWSPTGAKIAYIGERHLYGTDEDLYIMNPDGTGKRRLAAVGGDETPTWSPDGSQLAFVSTRGARNGELSSIYAAGREGGKPFI